MNVEFVGGSMDGQRVTFAPALLDGHDGAPQYAAPTGDGVRVVLSNSPEIDAGHGRYVATRSLTREGRLIYRFLGSATEARTPGN